MSDGQKKAQKRKEREKVAKARVAERRTALRAEAKKNYDHERQRRKLQSASNRISGTTIRNKKADGDSTVSQLEHNLAILKALEDEKRLADEMRENAAMMGEEKESSGVGGTADVVFTPNPEGGGGD